MEYDGYMTWAEPLRRSGGRKIIVSRGNDRYICSPPPQGPSSETPATGQAQGVGHGVPALACPRCSRAPVSCTQLKDASQPACEENSKKQALTHGLIPSRGVPGDPGVLDPAGIRPQKRGGSRCLTRLCGIVAGGTGDRQT